MNSKKLIESFLDPYISHEDYEKCGVCWRQVIKAEVAKEYLDVNKTSSSDLKDFFEETNKRWRETSLYKKVKGYQSEGKSLEEIEKIMKERGYEI